MKSKKPKRSVRTMEDIKREKQRLQSKVDRSREAFKEGLSLPSWRKTIAISLGGLAATSLISFALKNLVFKARSQPPSRHGLFGKRKEEEEETQVSSLARFAFLMPLLQTGLNFMLRHLESRMTRTGREE